MGIFVFLLWIFGVMVGLFIVRVLFLRNFFILEKDTYRGYYGMDKAGATDDDAILASAFLCLFWPAYILVWWVARPFLKLIDNKICRPASKMSVKESIKKALED